MAASKVVEIPGIGPVQLTKRSGSRNLRLSVRMGKVHVSLSPWTTYGSALKFAASHAQWINTELDKQRLPQLTSGQRIGKLHAIRFEQVQTGQAITSRVTATEIIVRMQVGESSADLSVQQRAHTACVRALKREAERLLPPRLAALAERHTLSYTKVDIKSLKRRWGSCDSHQAISLNLYLLELPWDYIDYVLLHELSHTKHMNHGSDFWQLLTTLCPRARDLSRQLRKHQPAVGTWQP